MSIERLSRPGRIYSRHEILSRPCPVPAENGAYAWFFKTVPAIVPTEGCTTHDGMKLLYVGISPDKKGKPESTQTLRNRIRYHYGGNAEGSTLRRSLGIILAHESGFPLRRVGSGKRMTFTHPGEAWLNDWLEENAFVTWLEHPEPWILEDELIDTLSLPLNIKGNRNHPFAGELSCLRKKAIASARALPVMNG